MSEISIKLKERLTFNSGVTPNEAEPIYEEIVKEIKLGNNIQLDFAEVNFITTAFLNVMIGSLYKDYTSEELKSKLIFVNLPDSVAIRIKKVVENAKLFYKDEETFNKDVEEEINGNN